MAIDHSINHYGKFKIFIKLNEIKWPKTCMLMRTVHRTNVPIEWHHQCRQIFRMKRISSIFKFKWIICQSNKKNHSSKFKCRCTMQPFSFKIMEIRHLRLSSNMSERKNTNVIYSRENFKCVCVFLVFRKFTIVYGTTKLILKLWFESCYLLLIEWQWMWITIFFVLWICFISLEVYFFKRCIAHMKKNIKFARIFNPSEYCCRCAMMYRCFLGMNVLFWTPNVLLFYGVSCSTHVITLCSKLLVEP